MKKSLNAISFLLILSIIYSCAQKAKDYNNTLNENYIDIPGSRTSLIPPEGFKLTDQVPQLIDEQGHGQIGIFEMPESFFKIATMYSAEAYEGIPDEELISTNNIYINNYNGKVLIMEKGNEKKYILLFGNNEFCVAIGGSYLIEFENTLANKIKESALSVVYDPNKELNAAEVLPYEISISSTKLKLAGATQSYSFYTVGGEDSMQTSDRTELEIGGAKSDAAIQWTDDQISQNIQDLMNYEGKFGLEIGKSTKVILDGMNGYETIGYVIVNADTIKIIYYVILYDKDELYGITGRSNMDFSDNLELFRNISKTFKRKKTN